MTWKETHWRTRAYREYPWTLSCMQVRSSSTSRAKASRARSRFWCLHTRTLPQTCQCSVYRSCVGLRWLWVVIQPLLNISARLGDVLQGGGIHMRQMCRALAYHSNAQVGRRRCAPRTRCGGT